MQRSQQQPPANESTVWLMYTNANFQQLALAASAANVAGITKADSSDIEIDELVASSTGLFSIYIEDAYGKPLMPWEQIPIYSELVFGVAQLPFRLPSPLFVPKNTSLRALFTDRSGAPNTIQAVLIGRKVG